MDPLVYLLIIMVLAWFVMIYLAIKRRLSNRLKWFLVVLTIWIGMTSYWLLGYYLYEPPKYPNSYIIEQYCQQYQHRKTVFNSLAACLDEDNVQDEIYFHHRVNNVKKYDMFYDSDIDYSYLREKPCFRRNADMISNYFDNIGCYKDLVWFARGDRNLNNQKCSLEKCHNPKEYYPNCTVYTGFYPNDTDTNCMYHIEGDWYVRLP